MNILTRGDLDGLTSSVLITLVEKVGQIRFAHPKDVQDGKVPVTGDDIVVNLPFVPGCGMWFDHHVSEDVKLEAIGQFKGRFEVAPSCARVIVNHYNSPKFDAFKDLVAETDRLDAAQLTMDDVTNPKGWILLGYTLDPRTGLGPEFQQYFRWLVEYVKEVPISKILEHYTVKKRVETVLKETAEFKAYLQSHSKQDGNVIITDLRGQKNVPVGNRFLIYTLFPTANVEMRIFDGHKGATVVAAGHSIFNRTCNVNVGELLAKYGGGGHKGAGTAQLPPDQAQASIQKILEVFKANRA